MLTQATQIKNVCVVDPAHLETDADMSLNETPKLSGGFILGNSCNNGFLFCISPICIPLTIPPTILGWLFYPISVSIRDPHNESSCGSQCANQILCFNHRDCTWTSMHVCCPFCNVLEDEKEKLKNLWMILNFSGFKITTSRS
jgi:hypothetical protein